MVPHIVRESSFIFGHKLACKSRPAGSGTLPGVTVAHGSSFGKGIYASRQQLAAHNAIVDGGQQCIACPGFL